MIRRGRERTFISHLLCASHLKYIFLFDPYHSPIKFYSFCTDEETEIQQLLYDLFAQGHIADDRREKKQTIRSNND